MAAHLEQELGVPVNVINATGGKGVTGHSRGLNALPNGYTLTMITLELNMMHWSRLTKLTHNDCTPLYSVNEDHAALFVKTDAKWNSLQDLEVEIKARPGQLTASGTASGGAWHLGIAGWLIAGGMSADDVTWVSSTGAGPSLQELISGGLDMVCCSLPEARTLLESGQVRALGIMAPKRALGFEEVKTFREQGTDWTLGAWRGLAVPTDTPEEIVDMLTGAIRRIVEGESEIASGSGNGVMKFPQFMETQRFDHTYRTDSELRGFLAETDTKLGELLTSDAMKSSNSDRFSPMIFPNIILGLMACVLVAMTISTIRQQCTIRRTSREPDDSQGESIVIPVQKVGNRGLMNFGIIVGAVFAYLLFVEVVGFVFLSAVIVFSMLCWLGTRLKISVLIAIVFVPLVYEIFASVLRVPLPRGWFGW